MAIIKITTPVFRACFLQLFEPKGFNGGEPKFSVMAVFGADADLSEMKRIGRLAAEDFFKGKLPPNLKNPLRDNAEKVHLGKPFTEAGFFTTLSTKQPPGLVDPSLGRIVDRSQVYAGIYMRATVSAYGYDQKGNRGVGFGLHNLQKVKDGERIDGRMEAENDFQAVEGAPWEDGGAKKEGNSDFLS